MARLDAIGALDEIRELGADRPVVILDDDATGSQAVREVEILVRPSREAIAEALRTGSPGFFVLTNSRSLGPEAARDLAVKLGGWIRDAARSCERAVSVISRSDSTLRGHFPIEVDALAAGLGMTAPRILLAPYFGEGGRVTEDDVHFLERGGVRTPVSHTEFAKDPVFAYRASNLVDWVREKAPGREVASVSIGALRDSGGQAVWAALAVSAPGGVTVLNAVEQPDIELAALGVLRAEADGLEIIARTAASFARARLGQPVWPVLETLPARAPGPGVVVVGSHVPTSTAQLRRLLDAPPMPLVAIELDRNPQEVAAAADAAVRGGQTPVIATAREVRRGADPDQDRAIAQEVARSVVEVLRNMRATPAWVVAKGGITSSDVAAFGLDATTATVVGQVAAGVSLWQLGPDTRFPGLPFVAFPGNVGDAETLRDVVTRLGGVPSGASLASP